MVWKDRSKNLKNLTCVHGYAVTVSNRFKLFGASKDETLGDQKGAFGERPRSHGGFVGGDA